MVDLYLHPHTYLISGMVLIYVSMSIFNFLSNLHPLKVYADSYPG
jgi:hypothetical protein